MVEQLIGSLQTKKYEKMKMMHGFTSLSMRLTSVKRGYGYDHHFIPPSNKILSAMLKILGSNLIFRAKIGCIFRFRMAQKSSGHKSNQVKYCKPISKFKVL